MLIGISSARSEETLWMLDKVCQLICSVLTVDGEGGSQHHANLPWHTLAKWLFFGSCGRAVCMQEAEGDCQGVV